MSVISFVDNNYKYVKSFIGRDYSELSEEIIRDRSQLTHSLYEKDVLYGYKITQNDPLTELYGANFYSVRFYLANIDTMHNEEQEKCMIQIMQHLKENIENKKGYYNLRIPTHVIDAVRAYNQVFTEAIFCGGTVEQYIFKKEVDHSNKNQLNIFWADSSYIKKFQENLLDMTYKSFESYQGQYHISHVTDHKAGKVYENWIRGSLSGENEDKIVVAEWQGEPIGFVTIGEDDFCVEGILSAVSDQYRQYGAYKAMIAYAINYAYGKGKCFITSTQFDNFIVQGVWNSLGLKPFYSIYNIHIDNLDSDFLATSV